MRWRHSHSKILARSQCKTTWRWSSQISVWCFMRKTQLFSKSNISIDELSHFFLKNSSVPCKCVLELCFACRKLRNDCIHICSLIFFTLNSKNVWQWKKKTCDVFSPWGFRSKQASSSQINHFPLPCNSSIRYFSQCLNIISSSQTAKLIILQKNNVTYCDETRIREEKSKQAPSNKFHYHSQRKQILSFEI